MLGVASEPAAAYDPPDFDALGVHHHERHARRLGQVEADLRAVAVAVAVRGEVGWLACEADHKREIALQLLGEEERGDRRDHQDREDRPDQGPGHRARSRVIGERTLENALRAGAPHRPLRRRPAVRPCFGRGAGAARPRCRDRHVALRARTSAGAGRVRRDRVLLPARDPAREPRATAPPRREARRARAGHAALPAPRRRRRRAPLPVAAARAHRRLPAARGTAAGAHDAQRDPARARRPAPGEPHGRGDRAYAPGRRAPGRRGAGARDPPWGVRAPHASARGGAAPARARGGRRPGGAVLRRHPALQGRRSARRGLPTGRRRRAVAGRAAAAWRRPGACASWSAT